MLFLSTSAYGSMTHETPLMKYSVVFANKICIFVTNSRFFPANSYLYSVVFNGLWWITKSDAQFMCLIYVLWLTRLHETKQKMLAWIMYWPASPMQVVQFTFEFYVPVEIKI